ncbi:MAG: GNAT family N-acyltransferase [Patescibacteria group bacterium]
MTTWQVGGRVLRAGLVTTQREREACYQLRYEEYHDRLGQIPPNSSGLDIDWCDAHSTHMMVVLEGENKLIGTSRSIPCDKGYLLAGKSDEGPCHFSGEPFRFPYKHPQNGHLLRPEETTEISRWVGRALPLGNGDLALVSMLLLEATLQYSRNAGVKHWVCAITDRPWRNACADGWGFIELIRRPDGKAHPYVKADGQVIPDAEVRVCLLPIPDRPEKDYLCRRVIETNRSTLKRAG